MIKDKGIGGQRRYFVGAGEPISLSGEKEKSLVCTEWEKGNIDRFIEHAEKSLGYTITKA